MTDLEAFENELRRTMVDVERAAVPPAGFEDRLLAVPTARPRPHRVTVLRPTRWLPPVLAAAAVVAVVAGGAAVISSTQSHKRDLPAPPGPTPTVTSTPNPTHTASPTATPSATATRPADVVVPTGFTAFDVSFIDADRGWALGNYDCTTPAKRCPVVLRTTDGGSHWTRVAAPAGIDPVNDEGLESGGSCDSNGIQYGPCVNQIAFADAQHGVLWSFHNQYLTDDAGSTWTSVPHLGGRLAVTATTVIRVHALTEGSSGGQPARLEVLRIGSAQWQDVTPAGGTVAASTLYASGLTSGVVYLDGGLIKNSVAHHTLYRSDDGGFTWTELMTDPCGDPVKLQMSVAVGADGSLALGCSVDWPTIGRVRVSTDGGRTFGGEHAVPSGTCLELWDLSATNLVCAAQDPTAQASTFSLSEDGGASWRVVDSAGLQFGEVHVLSTSTAYRVRSDGKGVVWTTDGGRTWVSSYFR